MMLKMLEHLNNILKDILSERTNGEPGLFPFLFLFWCKTCNISYHLNQYIFWEY